MGKIEKNINLEAGLTVYTAIGNVSGEDIRKVIGEFYQHGPVTRNVLWDVTMAELTELSAEDIRRISRIPRASLEQRQGGKTAIVAPTDLAYGLSRMYQASSDTDELPFKVKVFRNLHMARKWLIEKPLLH